MTAAATKAPEPKVKEGPFPGEDMEIGTLPERIDPGAGWNPTGRDIVGEFLANGNRRFTLAKMIAEGGLTHHKSPQAVMTIMLAAAEMGVPLMQALRGMYVVKGKLALEGHLMDGLAISRCGVSKTVIERTKKRCEIVLHRPGWSDYTSTFDLENAAEMGLIINYKAETGEFDVPRDNQGNPKEMWKKNTRQMLYWRALSDGLKVVAPDFFGGMYHADELSHVVEHIQAEKSEGARRDLHALMKGVEPDPDLFTDDEIAKFSDEIGEAVRSNVITAAHGEAMKEAVIAGQWKASREAWAALRAAVLDSIDPETMKQKEPEPAPAKPAKKPRGKKGGSQGSLL